MLRHEIQTRPDWKKVAYDSGFHFWEGDERPSWDESVYYQFSLKEIEEGIEAPTESLHRLCISLVENIIFDDAMFRRLKIPAVAWESIRRSWRAREPHLYGRFDLVYDGKGPAKMLEYNADTPTALYETGVFQWMWMEHMMKEGKLPSDTDQFNSVHDKLIERFKHDIKRAHGRLIHFTCMEEYIEDRGTVGYLEECAYQAGMMTKFVRIGDIKWDATNKVFRDGEYEEIETLFKLYPWEWMFADANGPVIPMAKTKFIEPSWKMLLSNKGILPLLWQMFPGHPNLLESYFEDDPKHKLLGDTYARKPLLSREGANVTLKAEGTIIGQDTGPYGKEGYIRQKLVNIPSLKDGRYFIIGSWVIGDDPAGMILRESKSPLTTNGSQMVPHVIIG